MNIEELKEHDVSQVASLQPEGWRDIVPIFDFYTKASYCFPVKVTIDQKIIGIGTAIMHNDVGWLAHIIVHSNYRNLRIGRSVTQTLVNRLRNRTDNIHLIATELGEPVYNKIGFETIAEYLFFKEIKADPEWTTSNAISLYTNSLKDQIIKLDKLISKEDRIFRLEEHLQNSYVYKRNNKVEGLYVPTFGEGLIIASTDSAGIELMKLRLATHENAAFPSDNPAATAFMYKNNYTAYKSAKRMQLGKKRAVLTSNIYNRIGGDIG